MNAAATKLNRSFYSMAATSFLGAFNDNTFRWLMTFFLMARSEPDEIANVISLGGIVFVTPFLIFTAFAGNLADTISKRSIIVMVKILELFIMILGCLAFMSSYDWPLYAVLFLMATQSAFFGPSKYGVIPELVHNDRLSKANGIVEMFTYVAIIMGTGFAMGLSKVADKHFDGKYSLVASVAIIVAIVGVIVSMLIKKTPAAGSKEKASVFFFRDIYRTLMGVRSNRNLIMTVFAAAFFLFIASFVQLNTIPYGMEQLGLSKEGATFIFLVSALGIGLGSLLAAKISGRGIEMGLIPLGAFGLTLSLIIVGFIPPNKYAACTALFMLGLSGGLFIVPLHAFIQSEAPREKLGKVVAASNLLGWFGVLIASGLLMFFSKIGLSPRQIFIILGLMMLTMAIYTVYSFPYLAIRMICLVLVHLAYKIKSFGVSNVPLKGGVLLISNHVSWVDAFLLSATQQRPIRFVMDRDIYSKRHLKPWLDLINVIPVSENDHPKQLVASLKTARQALSNGEIVCMFAEGTITRTGFPSAFKSGFEKVLKGTDVPVVPAYIGGAWGSIFSYYKGKMFGCFPRKFPRPISIYFGQQLPADSSASYIRQKVIELSSQYFTDLSSSRKSLSETFVRMARGNWYKKCMSDGVEKGINCGKALTSAIALCDKIAPLCRDSKNVGILLPPSTGAGLANIAVSMLGKATVNINYTVSEDARKYAIAQCEVKCVITSKRFLEKLKFNEPDGAVYIEDLILDITSQQKFTALLKAIFMPRKILAYPGGHKFSADDPATIIFSSGSTGTPKGIKLSHHNILSNIEAVRVILNVDGSDDLCAVLPLFHSFGFTCGLWLSVAAGLSVTFISNPLDAKLAGESVAANGSTVLFAPPTFLMGYVRRVAPDDFKSLRIVAAGAEKLKPRLAEAFKKRFGKDLLEGYGATELSPVAALNVPDVEVDGIRQIGHKLGTVGHPLPGVTVKIVDPSSGEILPANSEGLIMVKGPNLMTGYLNRDDLTEKVIVDGWYDTGDIGKLDNDGFVTITDRLARFSKIGGEMIPHLAIEEVIIDHLKTHEQVIAVTSIPDEKKGEQLVVLYTDQAGHAEKLYEIINGSDLPNIFKPKKDNFVRIDGMPLLGSGKLDIMTLRKIAVEAKNAEV